MLFQFRSWACNWQGLGKHCDSISGPMLTATIEALLLHCSVLYLSY